MSIIIQVFWSYFLDLLVLGLKMSTKIGGVGFKDHRDHTVTVIHPSPWVQNTTTFRLEPDTHMFIIHPAILASSRVP